MNRKFLGKEIPDHTDSLTYNRAKIHRGVIGWFIVLVAVLFLLSAFLGSRAQAAGGCILNAVSCSSSSSSSSGGGSSSTSPGSCDLYNSDGSNKPLHDQVSGSNIFPLIPDAIVDYNNTSGGCVPSLWNRYIIGILLFKALGLLNYVAGAIALLATVYAGILYLSSPISEATAKRAKTVLVTTYTGFFIVLGARLIIEGSFQLFSNDSNFTCVLSNTSCSTTPSPSSNSGS